MLVVYSCLVNVTAVMAATILYGLKLLIDFGQLQLQVHLDILWGQHLERHTYTGWLGACDCSHGCDHILFVCPCACAITWGNCRCFWIFL